MSVILLPRKCHDQFSLILLIIEEVAGKNSKKGLNKGMTAAKEEWMESPVGALVVMKFMEES